MDSEIVGSIDMRDITLDAMSFSWAVDSAIRSDSETVSNLGASPDHSFASVVDCAIRSRTVSNLGTSPVHSFASAEDNEMGSNSASGADFGTSSVHGFASPVDMRTTAVPNVTGYVIEGLQLFTLAELVAATNNFSFDNKIGAGSFTVVYRGKLDDGREVAIKREPKGNSAFKSKLAFLSALHHKNLVGLVGFCEEKDERLLVYEYMKNGSLYDGLHHKGSNVLNSWKMRIKIALDASRGIQYLHNLEVPPIILKDIKSSNILLDATWTAKVFDFERSFMNPEPDGEYDKEITRTNDEKYGLGKSIAKSDVYGLGVVLLELLTGMDATKVDYDIDGLRPPLNLVQFAVPDIMDGYLVNILDPRVGPPNVNEAKALEVVAQTAIRCVETEGKDRPTMAEIVVNLERALAICDSSPHDSISSGTISHVSVRKAILQHCIPVLYSKIKS